MGKRKFEQELECSMGMESLSIAHRVSERKLKKAHNVAKSCFCHSVLLEVIWLMVTHGGRESKKRHVLLWGVYGKSTGKPRETTQPTGPTATTGPTAHTGTTIASQWMHTLHLIDLLYILQVILIFCIYITGLIYKVFEVVHASAGRVWETGLIKR